MELDVGDGECCLCYVEVRIIVDQESKWSKVEGYWIRKTAPKEPNSKMIQ